MGLFNQVHGHYSSYPLPQAQNISSDIIIWMHVNRTCCAALSLLMYAMLSFSYQKEDQNTGEVKTTS